MGLMAPGTVFAGHRIEALVGRGGMGVVYRARDLELDRVVALKVIAPDLLEDPEMRARFVGEARTAASIEHPHVIPLHYVGEEDGVAFLAMRFVDGPDVRQLVHARRAAGAGAGGRPRRPGRRRAGRDPRGRLRPPRRQARQPAPRRRRSRVRDRLRPGQARAGGGPGRRSPGAGSARSTMSRRSRSGAGGSIFAPTSTPSAAVLHYMLTGRVPFDREGDEARLWAQLTEPPPRPSRCAARGIGGARPRGRAGAGQAAR